MAEEILPAQIDYTSRDFASLRDDLIARMRTVVPEWSANDPADFGLVLVEAFAHLGDVLSYYIDRAANESALSTATRRASVVALARDLGYEPSGYHASSVTVVFANSSEANITVPARTLLTAIVEKDDALLYIPFETDEAVTVNASSAASVTATQGETILGSDGVHGESLGISTGAPTQFFRIPSSTVVKESTQIYVFDGVNYYPWTQVSHLADYTPTSRVFHIVDDGYGNYYVQFGDGVSGMIPTQGHVVYAVYRRVDGVNGNVSSGTITEITSVPGLNSSQVSVLIGSLSVTNETAATGGSDPEDLASIRNNASQSYRTSNRAVTLEDYQTLALQVSNCGKSSAQSSVPSLVTLTVAPNRNAGAAEARPGYFETSPGVWTTTVEYEALKQDVFDYVDARRLAGVSLVMTDPVYVPIEVEIAVTSVSSVLNSDVQTICKQAIVDRFDYSQVDFGAQVLTTDLIALISSLGVTEAVTINLLRRAGDPSGVTNLVAAEDEIFLLPEANVTVVATGGAA